MNTNDKTQQGFANYFKKPSDTPATQDGERPSELARQTKQGESKAPGEQQARCKGKETFTKHNLTFSDTLFTKLKYIQLSTGKTQRELLDGAIRKFVEDYESKNGVIKVKSIEL